MTNRELRRIGRRDLLELLVQQEQENESLKARIAELETLLGERTISIESSGTMAEAAMALSGIFEAADKAAACYRENVRISCEKRMNAYNRIVLAAEQRATEIISEAEAERDRIIAETNK